MPAPPPLAPLNRKQFDALVAQFIAASLKPQRDQYAAKRKRTVEVAQALAELQKGIGPATNQAYQAGAQTLGGLAQGFTGQMRTDAEADAAAAAESLRRAGAPVEQIDRVKAVGQGAPDVAYALGGAIPGGALAREGAAATAAQNQLPATTLGRAQYDLFGLEREESELDAQIPKLRAEFSNQLIGQELSKAELALRNRAQALYEVQTGESIRHHKATESAAARRAKTSEAQYRLAVRRHELAVTQAANQGRNVNATISKRKGFLVDQRGRPILDANGKRIPIPKDQQGGGGNDGLTPYQRSQQRASAVSEARDLRGEPMENPNAELPGEGKFLKPGGGSTNNPREAQRDSEYTFDEAVNYIATQYGVSKKVARAWAIAAGWKAPKKAKKPQPKSGR